MKTWASILYLLLLITPLAVVGQEKSKQAGKPKYVRIPSEDIAVLIASQPDCPLKIEDAVYYIRVDQPGWAVGHSVRNVSAKPIVNFDVVAWNSAGAGGSLHNPLDDIDDLLMPGQVLESGKEGRDYEVIPMTDEVRRKLVSGKGERAVKFFWVLIVRRVVFEDGTVYNGQKSSDTLQNFLLQYDN